MATIVNYAGDTWVWETTLTDSDGNDITSLNDAWVSMYEDRDTESFMYQLADSEVTLASNVLTVEGPPSITTAIESGTYNVDVKIEQTDGTISTVVSEQRVKVVNESPLYDNY